MALPYRILLHFALHLLFVEVLEDSLDAGDVHLLVHLLQHMSTSCEWLDDLLVRSLCWHFHRHGFELGGHCIVLRNLVPDSHNVLGEDLSCLLNIKSEFMSITAWELTCYPCFASFLISAMCFFSYASILTLSLSIFLAALSIILLFCFMSSTLRLNTDWMRYL